MTHVAIEPVDSTVSVHPAWIEADLDALAANFREVRRLVGPSTKIIASVKGNAYGLGVVQTVQVLGRLGAYAVATGSYMDAMAIRRAGLDIKVQMFPGNLPEGIEVLLGHNLIPSIYNMEAARAMSEAAAKPAPVFIKVDCGLARLGIPVDHAEDFVKTVAALPNIIIEGIYTHLPFGDAAGLEWARPRLRWFDELVLGLRRGGIETPVTQSLASAGVACKLVTDCNSVCVGHLLFGGLARVTPDLADLSRFRPVLKAVKSRLIHVAYHPADETVGAGGQQTLKGGSATGVIPVGLYDGYRAALPGKAARMLVRGRRVPVLSVSQEYTTLDLTGLDKLAIGEEVVVLGRNGEDCISIEELADWFGGIPLNVLMSFNERFPYRYLGHSDEEAASFGVTSAVRVRP
jgi:alanine racemase